MFRRVLLLLAIIFTFFLPNSCRNYDPKKDPVIKTDLSALIASEKAAMDSLRSYLKIFQTDACFRNATVGYVVEDYSRGKLLLISELNSTKGLIPASLQKLLTTGAALDILGDKVSHEVTITNQMSINWRANRLLQKIGQVKYGKYNFPTGSRAVLEYWKGKGLDTSGMILVDGSGRSRDNTITARQLADVLFKMTVSHTFSTFYNSLPLAGLTGTMHKWLAGTVGEGRLRAKTGSLAGVRSYAGYVNTLSKKKLIFVIIVNDYSCTTRALKKKIESVMLKMVEL